MTDASQFVQSLYAAFGRGDTRTILDNLDPAIQWWSNGDSKTIPWAGRRDGVMGAASFFQALGENLDFEAFEPGEFHASGDTVTVLGRTRARDKNGGHGVFDCQWAHIFTVRNGKLARFREFYDTAAIERALGV
jgi:ketosteroid isomerase-like protein